VAALKTSILLTATSMPTTIERTHFVAMETCIILFYVSLTMHLNITLANDQFDAHCNKCIKNMCIKLVTG